ncbi:DUF2339 domain-containing protein [Rhizobium sp. SAFR-030]|uniref:DUF2339 domain-containing protein n=1 Tax=Rhizobium sp. SAFR-030 TaxID=3387277 RepID=UPI003F823A01
MLELLLLVLLFALLIWHRRLSQRLRTLETQVAALTTAVASGSIAGPSIDETADGSATLATTDAASADMVEPSADIEAARERVPDEVDEAPAPAPAPAPPRQSFESRFGARWPVWVGGLALALGGIFLVRYSIDSGLLGPAARLGLAAVFGLLLAATGEFMRRGGGLPRLPSAYSHAMIPGVLTAAASATLLATIYTAYAVYGFLGSAPTFAMLAIVSLTTLLLSLLHGQALAGLGLAASLVTPALVASTSPNISFLFGFLSLAWLAADAAARIRRWRLLPVLANLGLALWVLVYAVNAEILDPVPAGWALLVMVAGTAFLWPGRLFEVAAEEPEADGGIWRRTRRLIGRRPRSIMLSVSLSVFLPLLMLMAVDAPSATHPVLILVAVAGALAGLGAGRRAGLLPATFAALSGLCGVSLIAIKDLSTSIADPSAEAVTGWLAAIGPETLGGLALGAIFTLCGVGVARRRSASDPDFAAFWAILAAAMPVTLATITHLNYGTLGGDWLHGIYGLAIGLALLLTAERISKPSPSAATANTPRDLLLLGAFAAFVFALHTVTHGLTTTIGTALIGFAFVGATTVRPWRGLPWAMVAAAIVVGLRIAWEPTIVGPDLLGKTPVFNALIAGYGIPALLLTVSAWWLRAWPGRRVLNALQGLAALGCLMTVAILVRHAMNGGLLDERVPTLAEQSIYTLLLIGLSGILMTLDLKSPSRAFRYGSMLAGVIATLNVLSLHLIGLNPYATGEDIGTWPLINLLLPGYLMPALAYAGLALYTRGKRPMPYVVMLALAGAVLGFAWATLSVRWFWQGSEISAWKGFLPGETYTYSVVWLAIGVGLLALGSRLDARSLRLVSAGLVLVSVLKVFLVDMSNLEGILRAISFMGLGVVLIGIGLFYQRILARSVASAEPPAPGDAS